MLDRLATHLPPELLRFLGRLQYRVRFLGPVIRWGAGRIAAGEGVIRHGVGAGLRFRAGVPVAGYRLGTTEPEVQAVLAAHLRPGDVVYDVGANVGFYTVLAARLVEPGGHVYAFEPFPASASAARANAALNGFVHVTVIEEAVSEAAGTGWLETDTNPVTFRLGADRAVPGVEVSVTSLDRFVAAPGRRPPTFVKLDVEGAEKEALLGMAETLRRHRPLVLCEVHYAVSDFAGFVARTLGPLGYTAATLDGAPMPERGARYHVLLESHAEAPSSR